MFSMFSVALRWNSVVGSNTRCFADVSSVANRAACILGHSSNTVVPNFLHPVLSMAGRVIHFVGWQAASVHQMSRAKTLVVEENSCWAAHREMGGAGVRSI